MNMNQKIELINISKSTIFPSFVYSFDIKIDNSILINECYKVFDLFPEKNFASNRNGIQSKVFNDQELNLPLMNDLVKCVKKYSDKVLFFEDLGLNVKNIFYWVNINPNGSFNIPHSHPKADLIGIYYPKIKVENGSMVITRNDGSTYNMLYSNRGDLTRFEIIPKESKVIIFPAHLIHYVESNLVNQERISIAFNIVV